MWSGGASNIGEIHLDFSQPNQDNYLINDEKKIYAVFDGHGDKGHVISTYLKEHLVPTFTSTLQPTQSIEDSFKNAFQLLDDSICKSAQSESSGSTCVMAHVNNNFLYVAGVGDCTALLVQANPDGKMDVTSLILSHKTSNTSENERILNCGTQITGDYIVSKTDPNKVINMTRAFGDQDMRSAGIISLPDISITKLPSLVGPKSEDHLHNGATINNLTPHDRDTFLVMFSDGLDQVQSNDEIATKTHMLLRNHLNTSKGEPWQVNTICSNLLQVLEDGVYDKDGCGFNDDSTVIVVLLSGFSNCT